MQMKFHSFDGICNIMRSLIISVPSIKKENKEIHFRHTTLDISMAYVYNYTRKVKLMSYT